MEETPGPCPPPSRSLSSATADSCGHRPSGSVATRRRARQRRLQLRRLQSAVQDIMRSSIVEVVYEGNVAFVVSKPTKQCDKAGEEQRQATK